MSALSWAILILALGLIAMTATIALAALRAVQ